MDADIIRMAREAGWQYADGDSGYEPLWRFAALVRADEREACAKVCDGLNFVDNGTPGGTRASNRHCAAAIRARNHQPPAATADRLARHGIPMPGDEK